MQPYNFTVLYVSLIPLYCVMGYMVAAKITMNRFYFEFKKRENTKRARKAILVLSFIFWPIVLGFTLYCVIFNCLNKAYQGAKEEWNS